MLNLNGNVLKRLDYVDLSGGTAQFDCFLITPQNEVSPRLDCFLWCLLKNDFSLNISKATHNILVYTFLHIHGNHKDMLLTGDCVGSFFSSYGLAVVARANWLRLMR